MSGIGPGEIKRLLRGELRGEEARRYAEEERRRQEEEDRRRREQLSPSPLYPTKGIREGDQKSGR